MVEKSILDNGIRVVTEHIAEAHSVSIGAWIVNGSRHETPDNLGISHFIEHMLFKGTSTLSALDISKKVDAIGGPLNGFTGREYSCLHLRTLPEQLTSAIPLLADLLLDSTFDADEIEKERKVILQEIQRLQDTPDERIHDLFSQAFWPDNSLGQPVLGTLESVANLQREQILRFAHERYINSSLILCVAGPVGHEQVLDLIGNHFDRVAAQCLLLEQAEPVPAQAIKVQYSTLGQAHVCLGTQALSQQHPNRFAGMLLNAVLGGGMSSRLFQNLRENNGLAYCTYSYLNCHSDSGAMVAYASTPPKQVLRVVEMMLEELRTLRDRLISEEELQMVRDRLIGRLMMSLDSTYSRMERMALGEIYQGDYVSVRSVMRELAKVSPDNLQKLAHYLLSNDSLCLCVIGDVDDQVEKLQNITL